MQSTANKDLRDRVRMADLRFWQLADAIGIHEVTLSCWLRRELPATDSRRIRIERALQKLEAEQERTGQDGTAKDGNANDHGDS